MPVAKQATFSDLQIASIRTLACRFSSKMYRRLVSLVEAHFHTFVNKCSAVFNPLDSKCDSRDEPLPNTNA